MVGELVRYGIVGSVTAFVFAGSIWVCAFTIGGGAVSTTMSYMVAISVQYFGHALFTFKREPASLQQGCKFALTHMLGLAISLTMIDGVAPTLNLSPQIAALLTICVLAALNFILFRFWTFGSRQSPTENPHDAQLL